MRTPRTRRAARAGSRAASPSGCRTAARPRPPPAVRGRRRRERRGDDDEGRAAPAPRRRRPRRAPPARRRTPPGQRARTTARRPPRPGRTAARRSRAGLPQAAARLSRRALERGLRRGRAPSPARRRTSTRARSGASWRRAAAGQHGEREYLDAAAEQVVGGERLVAHLPEVRRPRVGHLDHHLGRDLRRRAGAPRRVTYHQVASRNWASSLSGRKRSGSRRKPVRLKISCSLLGVALVAGALALELDLDQLRPASP